jgi:hypothetical protein
MNADEKRMDAEALNVIRRASVEIGVHRRHVFILGFMCCTT